MGCVKNDFQFGQNNQIAENKQPDDLLQTFLREYRIPAIWDIKVKKNAVDRKVWEIERKEKEKSMSYLDKKRM